MADELKNLREAAHVIEGLGARLEQSIAGLAKRFEEANCALKDRMDLALAGLDKRLALMTAVFAICVGLGGAAFWTITGKIDATIAKVDSAMGKIDAAATTLATIQSDAKASQATADQLSQINEKMTRLLELMGKAKNSDVAVTNSVPVQAEAGLLLRALQIVQPPQDTNILVMFPGQIGGDALERDRDDSVVRGKDLRRFLSSVDENVVVRLVVPEDFDFSNRLSEALSRIRSTPHH